MNNLSNATVNAYAINARTATNAELAELGLSRQQYKRMSKEQRKNALRKLERYVLVPGGPFQTESSVLNRYESPVTIPNMGEMILEGEVSEGPGSFAVGFANSRKNRKNRRKTRKGRKNRKSRRANRKNRKSRRN